MNTINLKKALFLIVLLSGMIALSAKAQTKPNAGKTIFESNCTSCHGSDGTKGRWGAKNLRISTLTDSQLFATISNGRGVMPRWSKKLNPEQIDQLVAYIKTFRN